MNFIVSQSELLKNLLAVNAVINSKNTNPILDNFLFQVRSDKLEIVGSDGAATVIAEMPLESQGTGEYAVPAEKLVNTIKNLSEQPLTFTIENNQLRITAEKGKYNLPVLDGKDFPMPAPIADAFERHITGSLLAEGINKTIFATGNDELRVAMNGILFHFTPERLNLVATDAHKLVRFSVNNIKSDGDQSLEYILPKKPMQILKNLLAKSDAEVDMRFSEKNAEFSFENIRVFTTLIDGKFPEYERVIPTDNPFILIANRETLLASIRRVSFYANQSTYLVQLMLRGGSLTVTARNDEMASEADEELTVNYQGEDLNIGFNGRSLAEMLAALDSEEVEMTFSSPKRAALIAPMDGYSEEEEILMLLMPIAIG